MNLTSWHKWLLIQTSILSEVHLFFNLHKPFTSHFLAFPNSSARCPVLPLIPPLNLTFSERARGVLVRTRWQNSVLLCTSPQSSASQLTWLVLHQTRSVFPRQASLPDQPAVRAWRGQRLDAVYRTYIHWGKDLWQFGAQEDPGSGGVTIHVCGTCESGGGGCEVWQQCV